VIADGLENQVSPHDVCEEKHVRKVMTRVQALSEAVDDNSPCHVQKLINSLKLTMACVIDGIPNEYLRHLPRKPIVHLTHLFNHYLELSHFPLS
jgi:hypothetical protein